MTEPQGGSDPNLFKTHAMRDGEEWVINGEKWFTSAGPGRRHPLRDVHERHVRRARETRPASRSCPSPATTTTSSYNDVRVPLDHLLGPEDGAKVLAQRRLGGGRIHHAMRTIAQCKLAFDMMCERALSRESHGKIIGEHQMVQEKIADSYAEIHMLRLFVLETAWKIDNSSTAGGPHPDRGREVHHGQGAARGVVHRACTSSARSAPLTSRRSRRCTRPRRPWASPTASTRCTRPRSPATC